MPSANNEQSIGLQILIIRTGGLQITPEQNLLCFCSFRVSFASVFRLLLCFGVICNPPNYTIRILIRSNRCILLSANKEQSIGLQILIIRTGGLQITPEQSLLCFVCFCVLFVSLLPCFVCFCVSAVSVFRRDLQSAELYYNDL